MFECRHYLNSLTLHQIVTLTKEVLHGKSVLDARGTPIDATRGFSTCYTKQELIDKFFDRTAQLSIDTNAVQKKYQPMPEFNNSDEKWLLRDNSMVLLHRPIPVKLRTVHRYIGSTWVIAGFEKVNQYYLPIVTSENHKLIELHGGTWTSWRYFEKANQYYYLPVFTSESDKLIELHCNCASWSITYFTSPTLNCSGAFVIHLDYSELDQVMQQRYNQIPTIKHLREMDRDKQILLPELVHIVEEYIL